jgi:uncharacterized protein (TIGR02246 family)
MNRLLMSSAILISLLAPAMAQSERQGIEKLIASYEACFNKHDAACIGNLYAPDGILVEPDRHINAGRKAVEQSYQARFDKDKSGAMHIRLIVDQVLPVNGGTAVYVGDFHATNGPHKADGHFTAVAASEGGAWKIHLANAFTDPTPEKH